MRGLPHSTTPWPLPDPCLAASPAQPSRAGRLGGVQGRPSTTWSHCLVGRGGKTGSQRGVPAAQGPVPGVAAPPWPPHPGLAVPPVPGVGTDGVPQKGAGQGWGHHAGPMGALGGICVALSMGAGHAFQVAGRGRSEDGAGGEVTEPLSPACRDGPWQTPRTNFSKAGGQVEPENGQRQQAPSSSG